MRIFPLITALAVVAALYMLIMERDTLFRVAGVVTEASAQTENADTRDRVKVVAMRSAEEPVSRSVVLRGRTEAVRSVQVKSETSGLVISKPLRRGAEVSAGDPLCEVAAGVRQAALDEARARLEEAQISFDAAQGLSEGGFASETRLANARASLRSAQAAVDRAVEEMARLVMHAPFDGVLETDTAELGSLLQPGALCATLIQLDPMKLVGFATELQVADLKTGAQAGAQLASGQQVRGEVTFIARSADPQTRTYRVEVTVPNPQGRIRDGQSADIMVQADSQRGHMLPGSALTLNDAGTLGVRLVDDTGTVSFAPARLLRDSDDGVWLAGLPEQIAAIVVGQEFTRDGAVVDVTWREDQQ